MTFERSRIVKWRVMTEVRRNSRGGLLSGLCFICVRKAQGKKVPWDRGISLFLHTCRRMSKETWRQLTTIFRYIVKSYFIGTKKSTQLFLNNSTKQCPSWETNKPSASPKIPSVLWNYMVYHLLHNSLQIVLILSHISTADAVLNIFI